MNVLVVGGGAREHVIAETAAKHATVYGVLNNLNPGIIELCEDYIKIDITNPDAVADFAVKKNIELAIIGPEAALQAAVVDALQGKGIPCFGPTRKAALIETSKAYMRSLLEKYQIPGRLDFAVIEDVDDLECHINMVLYQVVVKPVGLTGGKGVKVEGDQLKDKEEAIAYAREIMTKKIGGSSKVVIEERGVGEELTIMAFCDGNSAYPMPAVQDHPHAFEGDVGPITGGMGSYSMDSGLLPFLKPGEYDECVRIMQQTIEAMKSEGNPYVGVLYGQFILSREGPKIVEFNARFGDPEAMNVLPLLKGNFAEICLKAARGELSPEDVNFDSKYTICKYVVPEGYGVKSQAGHVVSVNREEIEKLGCKLYFSSVSKEDERIITTSSRALALVGFGNNFNEAEEAVEKALQFVEGEHLYVRHDIGKDHSLNKRMEHMEQVRKG